MYCTVYFPLALEAVLLVLECRSYETKCGLLCMTKMSTPHAHVETRAYSCTTRPPGMCVVGDAYLVIDTEGGLCGGWGGLDRSITLESRLRGDGDSVAIVSDRKTAVRARRQGLRKLLSPYAARVYSASTGSLVSAVSTVERIVRGCRSGSRSHW